MFPFQSDSTMGLFTPAYDDSFNSFSWGDLDWNNIINQGFAIGSQAITAYSGQNTGTQFAYNPSNGGIFALVPASPYQQMQNPYAGLSPQQIAAMQSGGVGSSIGSGVDGVFNWLMANPLITFGGITALYLLFREPPRRR